MRIAPYGLPEVLKYGAACAILAVLLALASPWAWGIPVLGGLFVLSFFRDPERSPRGEAGDLVSPADGKVTDVSDVEHPFLGGSCRRIGIFLSVFDVHVNRAPCAGKVAHLLYKPGAFLDARRPDASRLNESNEIGLEAEGGGRVLVRQVSGAIARRIVCAVRVGEALARSQRVGMIKFGSRAELYFDPTRHEAAVEPGSRVRGGETVLARRRAAAPAAGARASAAEGARA